MGMRRALDLTDIDLVRLLDLQVPALLQGSQRGTIESKSSPKRDHEQDSKFVEGRPDPATAYIPATENSAH